MRDKSLGTSTSEGIAWGRELGLELASVLEVNGEGRMARGAS